MPQLVQDQAFSSSRFAEVACGKLAAAEALSYQAVDAFKYHLF